jgi:23S rRNA (cytidine1920-2'-O)/16S rRNA (cytidine1409-2'-O)-methyltransferase
MRLDQLLVERGLAESGNVARGLILAGHVRVGSVTTDKAGAQVPVDAELNLKERPRYVSRAGEKLAHGLDVFGLDVRGTRALDVGASTGGFVDCLLQHGAAEVIAVDVGYGQLDARLRNDPRVHVRERMNARYLTPADVPFLCDVLTADVSFISLDKILPAAAGCMEPGFVGILLVKPQFEAGPKSVGKGGIVRDPLVHQRVLEHMVDQVSLVPGVRVRGLSDSGLPGVGGNREFLLWVERGGGEGPSPDTLREFVHGAVFQGSGIQGVSNP